MARLQWLAGRRLEVRRSSLFPNPQPSRTGIPNPGRQFRRGPLGTSAPYQVMRADHPFFVGTGLSNGQTFGEAGLNKAFGNGEASGWEVDNTLGDGVPANV